MKFRISRRSLRLRSICQIEMEEITPPSINFFNLHPPSLSKIGIEPEHLSSMTLSKSSSLTLCRSVLPSSDEIRTYKTEIPMIFRLSM